MGFNLDRLYSTYFECTRSIIYEEDRVTFVLFAWNPNHDKEWGGGTPAAAAVPTTISFGPNHPIPTCVGLLFTRYSTTEDKQHTHLLGISRAWCAKEHVSCA